MTRPPRRLASLALAAALLAVAALAPAPAAAAGGGMFTVNTSRDSNTPGDSELSLREALEIAGGTLTGPFSLAEKQQMQGCTFDVPGHITNSCGGGNNLIRFAPTLTQAVVLSDLPLILVSDLTLDGAVDTGQIVIDGRNIAGGLTVGGDRFTLKNTAIINVGNADFAAVHAENNLKGLVLDHDNLGVPPGAQSCADPRLLNRNFLNLWIEIGRGTGAADDGTAYVTNSVIGCAAQDGARVDTRSVYLGQTPDGPLAGNWIGTDPAGDDLGNSHYGVSLNSTFATDANMIGNTIAHNGQGGVLVENSPYSALVNNDIHDNQGSGIWLTGNQTMGNTVSGGALHGNGAAGLTEGEGAHYNIWGRLSTYDNFGLGIDKNDNGLPDDTGSLALTGVVTTSQGLSVTGVFTGFFAPLLFQYQVDVYALAPDPSGYGEGQRFIGTTMLQGPAVNPTWSVLDPSRAGCYTAVLTLYNINIPANSTSYEFAANRGQCIYYLRLPLVRR